MMCGREVGQFVWCSAESVSICEKVSRRGAAVSYLPEGKEGLGELRDDVSGSGYSAEC
jgi:hypothetical protein